MYASLSLNDLNVFIEIATYHSLYYMYSLRKEFLTFRSNKDASQIHQLPVCSFHIRPIMRSYDVWLILNLEIFFEKRSIYCDLRPRDAHVMLLYWTLWTNTHLESLTSVVKHPLKCSIHIYHHLFEYHDRMVLARLWAPLLLQWNLSVTTTSIINSLPVIYPGMCFDEDSMYQFTLANDVCLLELI